MDISIKAALEKNKHVFDQILNQFEPDSDEDSSDDNSDEELSDEDAKDDDTEDEEPPMKRTKL